MNSFAHNASPETCAVRFVSAVCTAPRRKSVQRVQLYPDRSGVESETFSTAIKGGIFYRAGDRCVVTLQRNIRSSDLNASAAEAIQESIDEAFGSITSDIQAIVKRRVNAPHSF